MNQLYQQYQLGQIPYSQLQNDIKINQFERLIENSQQRIYNINKHHLKSTTKTRSRINCLDLDKFDKGKFLLSGHDDGSVSFWSLDDSYPNDSNDNDNSLINKKIKVSKRQLSSSSSSSPPSSTLSPPPFKKIRTTTSDIPQGQRLVSTSKRYNFYRGSNHPTTTQTSNDTRSHRFGISNVNWYGPDNGMFFTAGQDEIIKIWDTETFKPVQEIQFGYKINQMDQPATKPFIVVACEDDYPRLIDLQRMNLGITIFGKRTGGMKTFKYESQRRSEVLTCKINPRDSNLMASGDLNGHVKIWDLRMGNQLLLELMKNDIIEGKPLMNAHSKSCNDLIWNDQGNKLISIGMDGKIIQWHPFDNNLYENKFNDNENMNYFLTNINENDPNHVNFKKNYQIIGDIELMRNRFRKRVSKRLEWFNNKYLIMVTDYGELHIFDTTTQKYWNKLELPLEYNSGRVNGGQFTGIALQQDISNSRGIRLITGTSTTKLIDNVQIMSDSPLLEYTI